MIKEPELKKEVINGSSSYLLDDASFDARLCIGALTVFFDQIANFFSPSTRMLIRGTKKYYNITIFLFYFIILYYIFFLFYILII